MKRTSRAVWASRVAAWQESGLTAKAYAKRIGVKPGTLSHWKWQLGRETRGHDQPSRSLSSPDHAKAQVDDVSFVEVITGGSVELGAEPFEVVLSHGRRVRVPARFDAKSLQALLAVLELPL